MYFTGATKTSWRPEDTYERFNVKYERVNGTLAQHSGPVVLHNEDTRKTLQMMAAHITHTAGMLEVRFSCSAEQEGKLRAKSIMVEEKHRRGSSDMSRSVEINVVEYLEKFCTETNKRSKLKRKREAAATLQQQQKKTKVPVAASAASASATAGPGPGAGSTAASMDVEEPEQKPRPGLTKLVPSSIHVSGKGEKIKCLHVAGCNFSRTSRFYLRSTKDQNKGYVLRAQVYSSTVAVIQFVVGPADKDTSYSLFASDHVSGRSAEELSLSFT